MITIIITIIATITITIIIIITITITIIITYLEGEHRPALHRLRLQVYFNRGIDAHRPPHRYIILPMKAINYIRFIAEGAAAQVP